MIRLIFHIQTRADEILEGLDVKAKAFNGGGRLGREFARSGRLFVFLQLDSGLHCFDTLM